MRWHQITGDEVVEALKTSRGGLRPEEARHRLSTYGPNVLAIRSDRGSLFAQGLLSNKPLLGAVALTFLLQMATVYVPMLNGLFRTEALTPLELGVSLGASSTVFFAVEAEKWLKRRR